MSASWPSPRALADLERAEAHIWSVDIDMLRSFAPLAATVLDPSERLKALRYHFGRDRDRFVVGRAVLRLLLSTYLRRPPHAIRYVEGSEGKPAINTIDGGRSLQFNCSNSGTQAVYCFAGRSAVGIDVERVDRGADQDLLAERFFARGERTALHGLAGEEQSLAFFRCWTRKEAYVKALGGGLSIPLQEFEVSLMPHVDAALLYRRGHSGEPARWRFYDLAAPAGYVASVVLADEDLRILERSIGMLAFGRALQSVGCPRHERGSARLRAKDAA